MFFVIALQSIIMRKSGYEVVKYSDPVDVYNATVIAQKSSGYYYYVWLVSLVFVEPNAV